MQKEGGRIFKKLEETEERRREKEDIRIFRRSDAQKESGDGRPKTEVGRPKEASVR
ncbi:MAG: hypothetical protein RIF36_00500 [Imperialibacter sp.]|uniref:hypothetical protein n=1 Tax=Imperialibacter sp. TaxID=2038411 RepID=UPI0032EC924E